MTEVNVGSVFPTNKDGDVEVVEVISGNDLLIRFVLSGNMKVVTKCNLMKKMVADMVNRRLKVLELEDERKADRIADREKKKDGIKKDKQNVKNAKIETRARRVREKLEKLEAKKSARAAAKLVREDQRRSSMMERKNRKDATAAELMEVVGFYSKALLNDFRDVDGNFGKLITADGKSFSTRSNAVWNGIVQRSRIGGAFQKKFKHYLGTTVCKGWEEDFQVFAKWYTSQIGYDLGWDVEKDALSSDKHYSPETCVLLPRCVNLLFSKRHKGHGLADATTLDGVPRWRTKDGLFFTCLETAQEYQRNKKLINVESLRQLYVPQGVSEEVFDKAVNFIKF